MKKNLLILTYRTLQSAPRVIREIEALQNDFNIYCAGTGTPNQPVAGSYDIKIFRSDVFDAIANRILVKLNKGKPVPYVFTSRYRKLKNIIKKEDIDYLIIHEPEWLPYAVKLKEELKIKIIFNAHEYYPLELDDDPVWERTFKVYYTNLYENYLPKVDLLINVCQTIANECKSAFNVESVVIPNAAFFYELQPVLKDNDGPIRIIYHGNSNYSRKLEAMMEVVGKLGPGYQLDMMLTGGERVVQHYKELAATYDNVNIIPPVPFKSIIPFINSYHIGLYMLAPTNFNNRSALPNKFFEYLQARLCIAVSPNVEMKSLIEEYKLGVVADDYSVETMYELLKHLTVEEINIYKGNVATAAKKLNAEYYGQLFLKTVQNLG